jgi:hypothetical protein
VLVRGTTAPFNTLTYIANGNQYTFAYDNTIPRGVLREERIYGLPY